MKTKMLEINVHKYINPTMVKLWHIKLDMSKEYGDAGSFGVYADDILVKNFSFDSRDINQFDKNPPNFKIKAMIDAENHLKGILEEYL